MKRISPPKGRDLVLIKPCPPVSQAGTQNTGEHGSQGTCRILFFLGSGTEHRQRPTSTNANPSYLSRTFFTVVAAAWNLSQQLLDP